MKKKDFELIAYILKDCHDYTGETNPVKDKHKIEIIEEVIRQFTVILSSKYPKFDKEKFLIACGIKLKRCSKCHAVGLKNLCPRCGFPFR